MILALPHFASGAAIPHCLLGGRGFSRDMGPT
jgi:hypothetical protein